MLKRKRIRRLICASTAAVMLFSTAYGAGIGFTAEIIDQTMEITYDIADVGNGTMVYIFDTALTDDTVIDSALFAEHLVFAGKTEGGSTSFTLPTDAAYGVYTVVFGSAGLPTAKSERMVQVLRATTTAKDDAKTDITGAATPAALVEQLNNYNGVAYQLDLTKAEDEKQLIYDLVQEGGMSDVSELEGILATADSIYSMASADQAELAGYLRANQAVLNLDADIELYADAVAATAIKEQEAFAVSLEKARTVAYQNLALAALNAAPNSQIISVIEKYNTAFGVTIPSTLTSNNEYEVCRILENITFTDVAEVDGELKKAIREVGGGTNNTGNNSSGFRPSGGSGGGGGSYGSGGGVPVVTDEKIPEQLQEEYGTEDVKGFNDLEGYDWAKEAIDYVAAQTIMTGDGDGSFRPGDLITREE